MNLHRYPSKRIESSGAKITYLFTEQRLSWIDQALLIADLKFRDESGRYWYYDLYEKEWYYHENAEWLLTSERPGFLEGIALLFPEDDPLISEEPRDLDDATLVVQKSPHQALKNSAGKIREDYLEGRLSSQDAELIAMRHYLIDQQGLFWTVGLQSGDWFWMDAEGWERANSPPEEDQLLKLDAGGECRNCGEVLKQAVICPNCGQENTLTLPDLPEDVYERILEFMLRLDSAPEPVTQPWDPPGSYPGSIQMRFVERK